MGLILPMMGLWISIMVQREIPTMMVHLILKSTSVERILGMTIVMVMD